MRVITVYKFDELHPLTQERLVKDAMSSDVYHEIHGERAIEWGKFELLRRLGLHHNYPLDIAIDASFTQGSGMSFTGTIYKDDVRKPYPKRKMFQVYRGPVELVVEREQWGHYVHDNLISVTLFDSEGRHVPEDSSVNVREYLRGVLQRVFREVEDLILEDDLELAEDLVRSAEREYDETGRVLA